MALHQMPGILKKLCTGGNLFQNFKCSQSSFPFYKRNAINMRQSSAVVCKHFQWLCPPLPLMEETWHCTAMAFSAAELGLKVDLGAELGWKCEAVFLPPVEAGLTLLAHSLPQMFLRAPSRGIHPTVCAQLD